ncbi:MAG: CorA family divalent cation transporter [Saprospiraceae bacterium]
MTGQSKQKVLFLLGGHDLEMITIRDILEKKGLPFRDKNLDWNNALLSAYSDVFENEGKEYDVVYGIELREDIPIPVNYERIDHHNELSHLPSPIEQITKLIGTKIDRWQELVAANDKGYKKAMRAICATEKEIHDIREADRRAQGVTQQDEQLAEEALKKKEVVGDVVVIQALNEKYSPIADRIETAKLLIFDEEALTYYGVKKKELETLFADHIQNGIAYHGGGDLGYFGISRGRMKNEELEKVKKLLLEKVMDNPPYSYHLFLFPFQWDFIPSGKGKSETNFEIRTQINIWNEKLTGTLWKRNPFVIGDETSAFTDYNEFTYFYDFVRKTIFDYEDVQDVNTRLNYYQYESKKPGKYSIHIADGNEKNEYELHIINISMHVFNTGIGILTFNLRNDKESDPVDILRINEFGRRIYPQFLGRNLIADTKRAFLADKIVVDFQDREGGDSTSNPIEETFSYYSDPENLKKGGHFKLPAFIEHLFPQKTFVTTNQVRNEERIIINHIMDDRMFTLCWYGNNNKAADLSLWNSEDKHYAYECNKWWYSYIFCDKSGPTCANKIELKKYVQNHTYARWAEYGSLYGITRETFMMISSDIPTLQNVNAPPLYDHLRTIYFQIVVLCLTARASVLRFSGEVSRLNDLAKHVGNDETTFFEPIEKLYENYIEFLSKIHFKEVTAQIQGIEIYNLLYKHMNLREFIVELDEEIEELHRFANFRVQKKLAEEQIKLVEQTTRQADEQIKLVAQSTRQADEAHDQTRHATRLTKIAAYFLIPSLLVGIFGMNTMPSSDLPDYIFGGAFYYPFWISLVIVVVVGLGIAHFILKYILSEKYK